MDVDFQQAYLEAIGVSMPMASLVAQEQAQTPISNTTRDSAYTTASHEVVTEVAEPVAQAPEAVEEQVIQTTVSADSLMDLNAKAEACKACELVESRNQLVFGEGNEHADLCFIAEAPGREEDLAGKPFVGASGTLFERMLAAIGINRDDVYITHAVKCRPLHNRNPKPEEFAACEVFLSAQLAHVQPKVICMLGKVVAQSLLKTDAPLAELRQGQFSYRGIPVLVIDHPSYLLRAQQNKRRAWQDLLRLQSFLKTIH